MPRSSFDISPLRDSSTESLKRKFAEVNDRLSEIADNLARLEGLDGHSPQLFSTLNMQDNRVENVAWPRSSGDAFPLSYLQEYGVVRSPGESEFSTTTPSP